MFIKCSRFLYCCAQVENGTFMYMLKLLQAVAVSVLTVASLDNTVKVNTLHIPSGVMRLNILT